VLSHFAIAVEGVGFHHDVLAVVGFADAQEATPVSSEVIRFAPLDPKPAPTFQLAGRGRTTHPDVILFRGTAVPAAPSPTLPSIQVDGARVAIFFRDVSPPPAALPGLPTGLASSWSSPSMLFRRSSEELVTLPSLPLGRAETKIPVGGTIRARTSKKAPAPTGRVTITGKSKGPRGRVR